MDQENIAVVLHKPHDLRVQNHPKPSPPENDEVTLKINFCGICGTDVHLLEEGFIGPYIITDPLVIGHEASATVIGVGSDVTDLKVGDHVICEPAVPCEQCDACRKGLYNACDVCNRNAKGLPPIEGVLTRYSKHLARYCYKVPKELPLEVAALAEPLAVAVYSNQRGEVVFGSTVLICGAGTIGLLNLIVAKAFGAEKVVITDVKAEKLKLAKELGADATILIEKGVNVAEQVQKLIGCRPDVTLECTGIASCISDGILSTKHCGKVVLVGLGHEFVSVPLATASLREVDLLGVCRFRNTFPMTVKVLSSEQEKLSKMISKVFDLENALEAFEEMKRGNCIKILIKCN